MKKNYLKITAFIVLLCVLSKPLAAQALSGLYTINSGMGTGGTNFQTFNDFANAINTNGVSGSVTVNVVSGTGPYIEQVTFTQFTGASGTNNVIINGNNNVLSFNSTNSGSPHTLLLNGTDFMTVNDLNVEGLGTFALVCVLTNDASYNNFNTCKFTAPLNGTSSSQCPFSITGNATSATTSGNGGNYNTVTTSTMSNGYYGIAAYGSTGAPYTLGHNSFYSCRVTDFYFYGYYGPYSMFLTMDRCTFDRETRTSTSTVYGMYAYNSSGLMLDGNLMHKMYESVQGATSTFYAYYNYGNVVPSNRNTYRNNIITNIKNNSTLYGLYTYNSASDIYHNTIDLDYQAGTSGSTIYGIYTYGSTSDAVNITNNIITCRRGGSGSNRYGIYFGTATNSTSEGNNIVMSAGTGTPYIGYYNGAHLTLASWQAAGRDVNGFSVDPLYVSATDLHPTEVTINNAGVPLGLIFDKEWAIRNQQTPDIGALEFLTPTCASTPTQSIAGPNFSICPGETTTFSIGGLSSDLGYTYQWRWSNTSAVGPFTLIPGATSVLYNSLPITANSWYSAIITCTAAGGASIAPVRQVSVAVATTSTVPYFESFEGIGLPNRLPNCSWNAPNLGTVQETYLTAASGNRLPRTGSAFATFNNGSTGTNHYFTNGIWMEPGVSYSASLWYQTDLTGATNWSDLSIMIGTSQSATGLTSIVSTGGPAVSPVYKSLSGIFTVSSPGYYYVAVAATAGAGTAKYLSWDDLRIEIPCTPALNTPSITLSASSSTICSGQPVTLTASGADSFLWNNTATGALLTDFPQVNTTYMVTGTSTLTGCSASASQLVFVKQSPNVAAFAVPPVVCSGKSTNLVASGANSYNWSTGGTGANISVSPAAFTTYSVTGTGTNNCSATSIVQVSVNPLPNVTANVNNNVICRGDQITLTGGGAQTYQWVSNAPAMVLQGATAVTILHETASFTVTGTDGNGCSNTAVVSISADICGGLSGSVLDSDVNVYPNPTGGIIQVNVPAGTSHDIVVTDVTGRVVSEMSNVSAPVSLDLGSHAAGVYYVKVVSDTASTVTKVIRY